MVWMTRARGCDQWSKVQLEASQKWCTTAAGAGWCQVQQCSKSLYDLDDETEYFLSKFAADTRLRGLADSPEGSATIWSELDMLEKLAE